MPKSTDEREPFQGFARPNYTPVPDELFDDLLAFLTGAELKVLLYIIRRTFGFKRDADAISLSQMLNGIQKADGTIQDYGVGLSKPTLLQALRSLQEKEIVIAARRRSTEKGDEPTVYTLHFRMDDRGQTLIPPVVKNLDQGVVKEFDQARGQENSPGPWSRNFTTQETGLQETDLQETDRDLSKFRKGTRSVLTEGTRGETTSQPVTSLPRADVTLHETPLTKPSRSFQKPVSATISERVVPDSLPPVSDALSGISEPRSLAVSSASMARGLTSVGAVLANSSRQVPMPSSAPTPQSAEQSDDASPEYIENVIRDLSHEFSDAQHIRANATQALHLWQQSGLSVKAFVEVVYRVRRTTRLQTDVKRRMPYCFKLLRVELGLAPNPQKNLPAKPAEQSSPTPSVTTSLAGRYAHLVKRSGG